VAQAFLPAFFNIHHQMSSKRRLFSSRANSAKSSGPITPEGKQISSQNETRGASLSLSVLGAREFAFLPSERWPPPPQNNV
jgi:hypothetical protein